ncbi:hypothetical protein RvY_12849 [Ramazzottius varieornatus]|uniref:Uncharacterized protein n=1 Tax=Ramazzottius varieornatus TaxID=947166 RepID=A0A1D1VRA3_RAMVA|nr:hypothetical protein RvY_12849 [Ramazzottius varieornatus]
MSGSINNDDIQDVPSDYEEDFEGDNDPQDAVVEDRDPKPYVDDVDEFFGPTRAKSVTTSKKADVDAGNIASPKYFVPGEPGQSCVEPLTSAGSVSLPDSNLAAKKFPSPVPIRHGELDASGTMFKIPTVDHEAADHLGNEGDSRSSTPSWPLPSLSSRPGERTVEHKEPSRRATSVQPPSTTNNGAADGHDNDDDFPPEVVLRSENPVRTRTLSPDLEPSSDKNGSKSPSVRVLIRKAKLIPAGERLTIAPGTNEWQPVKRKPPVPRLGRRRTGSGTPGERSTAEVSQTASRNIGDGSRPSRLFSTGIPQSKSRPSSTSAKEDDDDRSRRDRSNQEERYQLARKKAVDRLKQWKDKKAAADIANQEGTHKPGFDSTYTLRQEDDIREEPPKLDIRQRQRSVKVPRFSRSNKLSAVENPKRAKSSSKSRPSTSGLSRARGTSAGIPLGASVLSQYNQPLPDLLQKRLVDFTVNDSKHSPKTSYWLFQEAFPELFWLPDSVQREELGSLLVGSAFDRRKEKMDLFDRMLYSTPAPTPPNILRVQYDDKIRQNSRGNSPISCTRPSSTTTAARSNSQLEHRSSKENHSDGLDQVRREEAAVKNQALVKAAEVGDFSPAGLQKVIDDFYGFFCNKTKIPSTLSAERVGLILADVYDELVAI